MSWEEDSVSFMGTIRRSGNSFVITIPIELINRFLLKEGQKVRIVGMSRKTFEFQGMVGVLLGSFFIKERVPGIELELSNPELIVAEKELESRKIQSCPTIENLAEKYEATSFVYDLRGNNILNVKIFFGIIGKTLLRPKKKEQVKKICNEIIREVKEKGVEVLSSEVFEEEMEWTIIDPSMIAKYPYKNSDNLRWEWKI